MAIIWILVPFLTKLITIISYISASFQLSDFFFFSFFPSPVHAGKTFSCCLTLSASKEKPTQTVKV